MTKGLDMKVEFDKDFELHWRTLTHNSLASLESTLESKPFYRIFLKPFFFYGLIDGPEQVLLKGICVSTAA